MLLKRLHGPNLLAVGLVIGFVVQPLAEIARLVMPIAVFTFILGTFVRADISGIVLVIRRPLVVLYLIIFAMIIIPVLMWTGMHLFSVTPALAFAVLLATASPPSSGNAMLAKLLGYKGEIPVVLILICLLLSPITIPGFTALIDGPEIGASQLWSRLSLLLVSTLSVAVFARYFFNEQTTRYGAHIDNTTLWALFIFAIGTMSGLPGLISVDPEGALLNITIAFATNILMLITGFMLLGGDLEQRVAIGVTFANRNVALVWATLSVSGHEVYNLYFACTQLPIFLVPIAVNKYIRCKNR